MMKGLDVSVHNGTIDWKKVRDSGLQFALIRAGYGKELNQKDARFDANMTGALAAGMKTGAYWFSYALNPEEAREEAQVCLQILAPYTGKMTLPVFYDFEYATEAYAQRYGYTFTKAQRTEIILAFMQEISKVYPAGYYTNRDYLTYRLETAPLDAWPLWLADYQNEPFRSCSVQQTTSSGSVPGITGNVDLDTSYDTQWEKPSEGGGEETPEQPEPSETEYTVRSGDTLSGIAQKFGVTVQQLLKWNPEIEDPNRIYPGQVIRLSGGETSTPAPPPLETKYTVRSGDTLSGIAQKFGVTVQQLLKWNPEIEDPNRIYPGQVIRLSGTEMPVSEYIVRSGDTLSGIAQKFGTTLYELLKLNPGIQDPNRIYPGQRIRLP